jgi:hypothetical protein
MTIPTCRWYYAQQQRRRADRIPRTLALLLQPGPLTLAHGYLTMTLL